MINAAIARARIPIHDSIEEQAALPLEVKVAFYRVAQEALNNLARHSEATQGWLSLSCRPEGVELVVEDDGQGFDLEHHPGADHYGLRIMHERAEEIGARFSIHSRPGRGARVEMSWPG